MNTWGIRFLPALVLAVTAAGTLRADVVTDWNATLREIAQNEGLNQPNKSNPGWATRTIAMTNAAIYDAFQAIHPTHSPYLVNTRALPNTSLDAAVHQAAYELLLDCYPTEQSILDARYNQRIALIPDSIDKTNGIALGHQIAQAYLAARAGDGADVIVPYLPGTGPGQWRADPYHLDQQAWGPGWGTVQSFAIPNTADFVGALPPIPAMNSPAYTAAFNMVRDYGELHSTVRTQDQEEMGLFWAYDRPNIGPPPVLFVRNLEDIAAQAGNTPEENARLFASASVAMADAAIAAWDAKFQYNFWRPVAAIHEADTDGNPDTAADLDWKPLGAPGPDPAVDADDFTPPFPAWTSGHATMGSAVFKSIELFYGTNVFDEIDGIPGDDPLYILTSEEAGSGESRSFSTFTQQGPLGVDLENSPEGENGMSRIYLGIHWLFDQQDGITLGNNIAHHVHENLFQPVPEPGSLALTLSGACMIWAIFRRRLEGS